MLSFYVKHYLLTLAWFSLKKSVMKIRPQVSGPTDVGFGNYILTAPVDRGARQAKYLHEDRGARQAQQQVLNVDDLLADINTLTNPMAKKRRGKSEL